MVNKTQPSTTSYLWIIQPYCDSYRKKVELETLMPPNVKQTIAIMAKKSGLNLSRWSGQILYSPDVELPQMAKTDGGKNIKWRSFGLMEKAKK